MTHVNHCSWVTGSYWQFVMTVCTDGCTPRSVRAHTTLLHTALFEHTQLRSSTHSYVRAHTYTYTHSSVRAHTYTYTIGWQDRINAFTRLVIGCMCGWFDDILKGEVNN